MTSVAQVELPVVGVLACQKLRKNGSTYSRVNDIVSDRLRQYGLAVVLIPAVGPEQVAGMLGRLDGLVLPGSGSFVHPQWYSSEQKGTDGREYDRARDEVAFALLEDAKRHPEVPILASCRGMQELAVFQGASLRDLGPELATHRLQSPPAESRWEFAHAIELKPGGMLEEILERSEAGVRVNSQHSQAIDFLSSTLRVEAVASDGTIEALSVAWPARWALGIQWHFEQNTANSTFDQKILRAFGTRCQERNRRRKCP